MPARILVIDNYDSFVYTIVSYLEQLGAVCAVVRNDEVELQTIPGYDGVLVSPGPGTPQKAGDSMRAIQQCADTSTPMLGVCLGHQALGEVYGATVTHAPELMHGKTSRILHRSDGVFDALPQLFTATRYHSLAVVPDTVPPSLTVTAWTGESIIMGLQHVDKPLYGVQFHPESVLTEGGYRILANWLALCGDASAVDASKGLAPLVRS